MKNMNYPNWLRLSIFFFVILFSLCETVDSETVINDPYAVEQADYLAVFYDSTFEVDSMFQLLTETLGLPVWFKPIIRQAENFPGELSYNGTTFLGNFAISFITSNVNFSGSSGYPVIAKKHFLSFTNYEEENIHILDSLGVECNSPVFFVYPDGNGNTDTLYRNVFFYRGNSFAMFFSHLFPNCYVYPTFQTEGNSNILDHQELHSYLKQQLDKNNGGPLGIKSVDKIMIATSNYSAHHELFRKLFAPVPDNPTGTWRIKNGPAIELVAESGISGMKFSSMVVNIRDAKNARSFLVAQQMEYLTIGNTIKLTGISKNVGFEFYLKEQL